jgi:arginine-tRNA-protein transferase
MESAFRFVAPASPCGYLPERVWRMEYEQVAALTPGEYMERLLQGWRRFGYTLFRPQCPHCTACQSLRVPTASFRPNRSQRRVRKANESVIRLQIGTPTVSRAKLDLFYRYHVYQADAKGWPRHRTKDAASYRESFIENPFPTQEWCYYLENRLIGVGYVDDLPGGLSAIYFYYDPVYRDRSLGTWNIVSVLDYGAARGIPHLYLGYYIAGCSSMSYKAGFVPNQLCGPDGQWRDFRP